MELWSHQAEAIKRAANRNSYGLLFEAGTGKSRTFIEIFRDKCRRQDRLLKTLIIAPQVVLQNWKQEFLKYAPKINQNDIVILKGSGRQRAELIRESITAQNLPKIFVANYESLLMEEVYRLMTEYGIECCVADESHRIKSPTSKRSKALIKLGQNIKYKYILTGTPVLQSPLDLFTQIQFLDNGKTFAPCGTNFFAFRNAYFVNKNANAPSHVSWPDWRIRQGAVEDISSRISNISMHVKKSECLDLPPLVKKTISVELSKEQQKHYEMMKKNFITFLNDKACTAQLAITKGLRLQQIVSGFIALEDGQVVNLKDNPRAEALKDLLEDLVCEQKQKVIIWACWRENYRQIAEVLGKLKIKFVEVHGEISSSKKQESIEQFCKDSETYVFLGNQGSGGIGINLVEAPFAIYYSRNFNLEHDIQSEARNYRGGSEVHQKVTRIDLVAQGTIDESILIALASKQEISDKLLREVSI